MGFEKKPEPAMGPGDNALKNKALRAALKLIELWLGSCRPTRSWHPEAEARQRAGLPMIGAMWHSQLIYLLYHMRQYPAVVMVSGSSDGEWVAKALKLWNQHPVRGSRFKGGSAAIREMARLMKEQRLHAGIIADGSQGPAQKAQIGALVLSRATGFPIVPVAAAARPAYHFNSWDRMFLPLPFSRVAVVFGRPFQVPEDARGRAIEPYRAKLEESLNRATSKAARLIGLSGAECLTGK